MNQIFTDKAGFGVLNGINGIQKRMIENISGLKVDVESLRDFISESKILSKCSFISHHTTNTKVPYLSGNNVDWKREGDKVEFMGGMSNKEFSPYRLTVCAYISKMLLSQNDSFDVQLKEYLVKALEEKLIETILTSNVGIVDEKPNGIFYNVPKSPLSSLNDLIDLSYNLDLTKSDDLVYIISPKAKQMILKADNKALDNDKLLGKDFIIENKLENGLIAYLDLSKLMITKFGDSEITIDPFSKAYYGLHVVSLNSYFDYGYLDNDYMRVGDFMANNEQTEP